SLPLGRISETRSSRMTEKDLLEDRVVIVTGGGRGLGRSHCLELAAHGATVVVNDIGVSLDGGRSDDGPAQEVVEAIRGAGGRAMLGPGSVTDWDAMGDVVATAVAKYGKVDAIVNNAGILRDSMIVNQTEQDWDAIVDVHLKGTFNLTRHACAHWRS